MIYVCACLLLDPFQLYLEMSAVFGLSIYTATANSCTAGNENVLLGIFFLGVGGGGGLRRWNFNKNVVLQVIEEKMKICYFLVIYWREYPKQLHY